MKLNYNDYIQKQEQLESFSVSHSIWKRKTAGKMRVLIEFKNALKEIK